MYVTLTLFSLLPLLVVFQVLRIHLAEGGELRERGKKQAESFASIPAMRGAILDQAGRMLAVNTVRYDIALDPTVSGFTPAVRDAFFEQLSKHTGIPVARFHRKLRERTSRQYVLLLRDASEEVKEAVDELGVPGVIADQRLGRRYNYGSTAAHVLGHVGGDGKGLAGLELQYDASLDGTPGRRAMKRDRRGVLKAFVGGKVVEPRHGQTLRLTIDLVRQAVMEEELARGVAESGAAWGTAIAMDPRTGAILGLANVPTYDPNQAGAFPEELRRNRAITDRIEPGSTFKLVAAVAAVEQGVVEMDDLVDTGEGWAVFGGRTMHDTKAHGVISFEEVIAVSSNVGMARTASKLDPGVFYQYVRNLGFGQPSWVDLPGEVTGSLRKPTTWSGTTLTSMSIGYAIDATPLQILTAYCTLANGGLLVQPYVVAERLDVTGRVTWQARQDSIRRAFDQETARTLLPAFERVVSEGTGLRAQVPGLRVAGKTGTALKVWNGSYRSGAYRSSFVGFFPAEAPAVALIVILDEPQSGLYGGAVSAPIFQRIAARWTGTFPEIAEGLQAAQPLPEPEPRPLPALEGWPAAVAASRLASAGYETERPDAAVAGDPVQAQWPKPGSELTPGAQVRLDLQAAPADEARMPDLTGLGARQATFWLRSRGAAVRVEGHGQVVSQEPRAGAPLAGTVVLRCR